MKTSQDGNLKVSAKKKPAKKKTPVKKKPTKAEAAKTPARMVNCQLPGAEMLSEGKSVKQVMAVMEISEKKELKPEHDRFCREYIIDDNATRAYQRAYPNCGYNTANVEGCRLLAKPSIKAMVEQLRAERNKRLEISADKVLRRLEARASVSPRDLYKPDGTFIPVHELHPDVAIGIKSIEVVELYDKAGPGEDRNAIGLVRKITIHDGRASDELLGKNLKLWKEVGSDDNPIKIVGRIELVPLT